MLRGTRLVRSLPRYGLRRLAATPTLLPTRRYETAAWKQALQEVVSFEPVLMNSAGQLVPERPTPIFIASGEGVPVSSWLPLVRSLQNVGFSGIVVPFPAGFSDIAAVADLYQQAIYDAQLTPPLMVAQSLGTLCALKFLESYSISGLVMLNPLPPLAPSETISILLQEHSEESIDAEQSTVRELLQGLTKVEGVVLEPRAVPALVVITPADARVLGPAGGAVEATLLHMCGSQEDDERSLLRLNSLEESSSSLANKRNAYANERCVSAVVTWLDELA